METLDTLATAIKHVDAMLDEDALEPDPERADWGRMKVRIGMVRDGIDEVAGALEAALEAVEEAEVTALIKRRVASLFAAAGAMLQASGDAEGAAKLRAHAADLAPDDDRRAEIHAGDADPRAWTRLHHARWLLLHRQRARADQIAKALARETKEAAIRKGAREILHAPRAIDSAPPLFRVNGCGVGLYGERDRTEDGWYVATYCLCLVFIPILPLTAYRVREIDGGYQFLAKERLGPIARLWQLAGIGAVVLAVGWGGVSSYLDSPERKARVALDAARAAEAKGDRQGALERYGEVARVYGGQQDVSAAAEAVIRLSAVNVPEPCTADAVDKVGRVVDAFYAIPPVARASASVVEPLVKRLEGWAAQIGDGSSAQIHAALTVLDMAAKVADKGPRLAAVDGRRAHLRRVLADRVAEKRPLQALALCAKPPADPEALAAAAKIIEGFGAAPSLWIEAEHDVVAWAKAAEKRTDLEAAQKRARAALAAAHTAHDADAPLIQAGDEKQLAAALARAPGDQELAVALAQIQRRKGDVKAALATLGALGPPGRLTALAQQVLAACHAEAGDLAKADGIITDLLDERLPAFQEAQRELEGAAERAQKALVERAKAGDLDPGVKHRIEAAPEADRQGIFRAWLSEKLEADPSLKALRAEYVRHDAVVPASLALGTIKLRRASAASGAERRALLAAAEKVYLSIHQQAEGDPGYHLGLGQVYHRLGRTEEGNAELSRVLARKDPELTLGVAHVYRELGLTVRARQVAEGLWSTASEDRWKQSAASMMAHLVRRTGADEAEEEMWIRRSDTTSTETKLALTQLEARRLRRQGKLAEADRAYAKLCESHERDAGHDAASANNAAVAYLERYGASGDPAHVRAAVKQLESAHRLVPQNAIVAGNLADAVGYAATLTVLDRWIKTRSLALDEGEALALLDALVSGPLRDEVLAALRKEPSFHRSLDLAQEEQALAPQKHDGYQRQIRWLEWIDDDKALSELAKRIAAMPPFDASAVAEARQARQDPAKEAQEKAIVAQVVKRSEDTVARVERAGHEPTLAVARFVLAVRRAELARLEPAPEHLDAMLDGMRKATQGWPEGGMDARLGSMLAWVALLRAAPESPAVAKVVKDDNRFHGTAMLLQRAVSGPDGAGAIAALRRRPELLEAAKLRKAHLGKRPELLDVVLARVAGDAEMEQAASAVFQRGSVGAALEIGAALAPGQEVEKYELDFFRSGAKPAR